MPPCPRGVGFKPAQGRRYLAARTSAALCQAFDKNQSIIDFAISLYYIETRISTIFCSSAVDEVYGCFFAWNFKTSIPLRPPVHRSQISAKVPEVPSPFAALQPASDIRVPNVVALLGPNGSGSHCATRSRVFILVHSAQFSCNQRMINRPPEQDFSRANVSLRQMLGRSPPACAYISQAQSIFLMPPNNGRPFVGMPTRLASIAEANREMFDRNFPNAILHGNRCGYLNEKAKVRL